MRPKPSIRATTTTVIVNGAPVESTARTLGALLIELGYAGSKVATAINGTFVAERDRDTRHLTPGDAIEVVSARQGG